MSAMCVTCEKELRRSINEVLQWWMRDNHAPSEYAFTEGWQRDLAYMLELARLEKVENEAGR